jgi:hypothetical protein
MDDRVKNQVVWEAPALARGRWGEGGSMLTVKCFIVDRIKRRVDGDVK